MSEDVCQRVTGKDLPTGEDIRCGAPLDRRITAGSARWCKACWAAYHREYEETKAEMAKGKGYCAGASAMREYLAAQFQQLGTGLMTGDEVAAWIRSLPGPHSDHGA